jgi:hypothetical protein
MTKVQNRNINIKTSQRFFNYALSNYILQVSQSKTGATIPLSRLSADEFFKAIFSFPDV